MVHDAAERGYNNRSETYAAARPGYHPWVLDVIANSVPAGRVVDLGAGTGIATTGLAQRGLDVLAVEPVTAMRETLQRNLAGITAVYGTAESIPVETGSAAAVLVAQAFHWFDHEPALNEIARVLAPEGQLVTLWNVRDESVPWMADYTAIQDEVQGDTPRYRTMRWRDAIEADHRFVLSNEVKTPNPQPSNADHTVGRFLSTSFIARLDAATQRNLELRIRDLVSGLGERYDFPYWTEAQFWDRSG